MYALSRDDRYLMAMLRERGIGIEKKTQAGQMYISLLFNAVKETAGPGSRTQPRSIERAEHHGKKVR